MTLARAVKRKTKYDLKAYCELRGLSLSSMYKGYISLKAKKMLEKDGINLSSIEYKVAGGSDSVWAWANKKAV